MANKSNSLAHKKWMRKYHITFTPKYRRKIIYNQYRKSIGEILRLLCKYKGVEIIKTTFLEPINTIITLWKKLRMNVIIY